MDKKEAHPKPKDGQPSKAIVKYEIDRTKNKAEDYLHDPQKSQRLLDEALRKSKRIERLKGPLVEMWESLKALFRMLQAYVRREYTRVPWGSIVLATVAVLYFVSPFDLVPDWLPLAGFIDDAAVIAFVLRQIKADLDAFTVWETEQGSSRTGR
jgi:uncharacterized membrane protein YkvA (DUF1232 family)